MRTFKKATEFPCRKQGCFVEFFPKNKAFSLFEKAL